ncbi:hypothetical protein [Nannocystis bainbridge]|uniref:Uncharacterized protein n=1 Tax=Nannocystis bainbridge TaxID=2995303 RepID=A0ABT5ECS6_9BACT|nr:hypothetical protein [Nannocystis bainbridge]MDC0723666.1 hypothetical protein [Nannocystis bainbridge]
MLCSRALVVLSSFVLSSLVVACGDSSSGPTSQASASESGATDPSTGSTANLPTSTSNGTDPTTDGTNGNSNSDGTTTSTSTSTTTTSTTTVDPSTTSTETTMGVDTTTTTGGFKFDLGQQADVDVVMPGKGSCRPSETYGAAGGFPKYTDPAFAPFLEKSIAIVTHTVHNPAPNDFALTIVDISGDAPPPNTNYLAPLYHHSSWTSANLGRIFGVTLDSDGNIYVAATTAYGANPTPAVIKRIDSVTGVISTFATLPNNGPAFGNLNYDCVSETIYVSNFEDGRIYQVDLNGQVVSTFHHASKTVSMGLPNDPGEPNGAYAPLGERPWAVQSNAGRLYYSLWVEHSNMPNPNRENEVWSVGYVDETGVIDPSTAKLEFSLPTIGGGQGSSPVSDISFAQTGWMLVAQRTMIQDNVTSAHQSTTFEYDYQNGQWVFLGTTYVVGELLPYSACGGVDHSFEEDGYVWMTGDALDFYTPNVVYGLQGTPYGGGGIATSTIIDLDHEIVNQDKGIYGDVEIPIPGDATPVPPPM